MRRSRPQNAVDSIAASKQIPFSRVLFGLNIPDVGWVTAQNLARHFVSVDALLAARQEDIEEVEGIGPDRAESIATWFAEEKNRALIEELRSLGIRLELGEAERPVEGPAHRPDLRDHGDARALVARAGAGRPRGEWRQGDRLGLEEDDCA